MSQDPTLPRLRDDQLTKTVALPNRAASKTSSGIDLGSSRHMAGAELLILVPALGVTPLANAKTMTYVVEFSADSGFGSISRTVPAGVQTGAGGVGAAADEYRVGIESTADRYCRLKATGSTSGDASGSSATIGVAV